MVLGVQTPAEDFRLMASLFDILEALVQCHGANPDWGITADHVLNVGREQYRVLVGNTVECFNRSQVAAALESVRPAVPYEFLQPEFDGDVMISADTQTVDEKAAPVSQLEAEITPPAEEAPKRKSREGAKARK